jgi:hypothetical protein
LSDQDPNDSIPLSSAQILDVLEKGVVETEHGMMRWSSNYTFLVSVTHEDLSLPAVYKPQRGERPLWDFPDGTLCYRERASFLTSEELGWDIVPPTVLREGPRGLGSIQFYVAHDPEINYFNFDESVLPQLMRISIFDFIVNNADRKGGHCLLDDQNHVWGIDHGITFNAAPKLRTVIWNFAGQAIPEPLLQDLDRICGQLDNRDYAFRNALCDLLTEGEVNAFHTRVKRLLQHKRYPLPGPGPNYPWPPV